MSDPDIPATTHHAKRRFKQRAGLPARAVRRAAKQAFAEGLPPDHPDIPEEARRVVRRAALRTEEHRRKAVTHHVRFFRGLIFVFAKSDVSGVVALVTVLSGKTAETPLIEEELPPYVHDARAAKARRSQKKVYRK